MFFLEWIKSLIFLHFFFLVNNVFLKVGLVGNVWYDIVNGCFFWIEVSYDLVIIVGCRLLKGFKLMEKICWLEGYHCKRKKLILCWFSTHYSHFGCPICLYYLTDDHKTYLRCNIFKRNFLSGKRCDLLQNLTYIKYYNLSGSLTSVNKFWLDSSIQCFLT